MTPTLRDYIAAHYKAIIVAVGAVLVLVVDAETADKIIGALTIVLTIIVGNDPDAVDRVYRRSNY